MILPRPRLVLAILALLAATNVGLAQETAASGRSSQSKPDRSAEALFRKMLESHGKLRGLHVLIWNGRQDRPDYPFQMSSSQEFWFQEGAVFRIENASYFGGTSRVVSDGVAVLNDPMDLERPVTLSKAGKAVVDSDSSLGLGRRSSSVLFALLGGVEAFDSIVAPNGVIHEAPADGPLKAIRVGLRTLGTAVLYYAANDPQMLLRRVDTVGTPTAGGRGPQAEAPPGLAGDSGAPDPAAQGPQRVVRQNLYYRQVGGKLDADLFSTEPPKGVKVNDLRKEQPKTDTGPFSSDPPEGEEGMAG